MLANNLYDRFGQVYNVSRVLDSGQVFDQAAYDNYSHLYMPASYAMTYLMAFALASCVIVHTILYHGRTIYRGIRRLNIEKDDIHAKLMRAYPEVPEWWYLLVFSSFFCLAIVSTEVSCASYC